MEKLKLDFELVPDSCWKINLRSILPPAHWNFIKAQTKLEQNNTCAKCGKKTSKLDCHEVWEYDREKKVQKLVGVIGVCRDCHEVIHIGLTSLKGKEDKASEHFMKVNNCSYAEYRKALGRANEENALNNKVYEWQLDINYIKKYDEILDKIRKNQS